MSPHTPVSDIGLLVERAVAKSGLSRRALARRASIAPETLSRICGRGTGDFATVSQVIRAAGLTLDAVGAEGAVREPKAPYGHDRLDARSLAMHALIAGKLVSNPALLADKVLPTIQRFKRVHAGTGSVPLLDAWERAARAGVLEVLALCVDPSETGRQLRQASPLSGLLLAGERRKIYEAFAA